MALFSTLKNDFIYALIAFMALSRFESLNPACLLQIVYYDHCFDQY